MYRECDIKKKKKWGIYFIMEEIKKCNVYIVWFEIHLCGGNSWIEMAGLLKCQIILGSFKKHIYGSAW